jgi:hypothetical protein
MENGCQAKRLFESPEIAVKYLKSAEDLFRDEEHLRAFTERIIQCQAALINLLVEETHFEARVHRFGQKKLKTASVKSIDQSGTIHNHDFTKIVLTMEDYKHALCEYRYARKKLKQLLDGCSC